MTRDLPEPNPIAPAPCSCGCRTWLRQYLNVSGGYYSVKCEACRREGARVVWGDKAVEKWNAERAEEK